MRGTNYSPEAHERPSEVLATVHAADALVGTFLCGDDASRLDLSLERAGLLREVPRWRALVERSREQFTG